MVKPTALLVAVMAAGPFVAGRLGQAVAAERPLEDVLSRVPLEVVGFLVVPHLEGMAKRVDAFAKVVSPPGEPALPAPLLELFKARFGIGEGFEPRGGLAVLMLDGRDYGLDLPRALAPPPGEQPVKITSEMVPAVALVPGANPERMFAVRKPKAVEGVVQFTGEYGKPRYCLQVGGYVALGPNLKAVRAVAAGGASVVGRLGEQEKAFINSHDLSLWLDGPKAGPMVRAVVLHLQQLLRSRGRTKSLSGLGEWLEQMRSALVGVKFGRAGLVVNGLGTFAPDSALGKVLAAYEPAESRLLERLPGGPYVLALGVLNAPRLPAELRRRRAERFLAAEPFSRLPEPMRVLSRRTVLALGEQLQSVRLWVGRGSQSRPGVRVACVLECASATETRKLLADLARVVEAVVNLRRRQAGKPLSIRYLPGVVMVEGRQADAIVVVPAGQADQGRRKSYALFGAGGPGKAVKAVLGPGSVRLLVSQADERTVVVTLGAGDAFPGEAVRATRRGPRGLLADAAVRKALAMLPAKRTATAVMNLRRFQRLVRATRTAAGKKVLIEGDIPSDVPIAVGVRVVDGSAVGFSVVVPTETAKAVVKVISTVLAERGESP